MLRWLHAQLVKFPLTRGPQRRFTRRIKRLLGCPDAYEDLIKICRKVHPAAVLDIGAHEGDTVLKFLDELKGLSIHAFEPAPEQAAVLRRRLGHIPSVTTHQCALADKTGSLKFHLNAGSMTSSLLENASSDYRPFEGAQAHVAEIEVEAQRLDDWATKFVPEGKLVIKMDVQGAEGLVIAGARQLLADGRIIAIYSEVCLIPQYEGQATFDQIDTAMRQVGLVLFNIYPCGKDSTGRAAWTDMLWVRAADVLPL
jgi:FkbM family methyltransferase